MAAERLVGVDIGGTNTRVRVRHHNGTITDNIVPTSSWRPVEQRRDPRAFLSMIREYADLSAQSVVVIGAHGCDTREQCRAFASDISAYSPGDFTVVNDAELLVPAAGLYSGIGVVVGTGSIVVGQTADDDLVAAGGWGWILGDPGSAPGLVRDSVRAVLTQYDRGSAPGLLARTLLHEFGVNHERELAYALTAAERITDWSDHAPAVFEAVDAGSRLAQAVLSRAADELLNSIEDVWKCAAQGSDIVLGGGVLLAQPDFAKLIAQRAAEQWPSVNVSILAVEPLAGAYNMAYRRLEAPAQRQLSTN